MKKTTCGIVSVNIIVFLLLAVPAILFKFAAQPFMRGYYCGDTTIDKPLKTQTVPIVTLLVLSLLLAIVCFLFGNYRKLKETNLELSETNMDAYKQFAYDVATLTAIFIYGLLITLFITDIGKYTIGRLRPHYLSACNPDWSRINCTNAIGRNTLIITDKFCQTTDLKVLKEAHLSFPSGHASFAAYCATFLVLYLEWEVKYEKREVLVKTLMQALIAAAALFVGLSRVVDYFHHATDVLTGFLVGLFLGIAVYIWVLRRIFRRSNTNEQGEYTEIIEVEESPLN